jgi:hypothetical protein
LFIGSTSFQCSFVSERPKKAIEEYLRFALFVASNMLLTEMYEFVKAFSSCYQGGVSLFIWVHPFIPELL